MCARAHAHTLKFQVAHYTEADFHHHLQPRSRGSLQLRPGSESDLDTPWAQLHRTARGPVKSEFQYVSYLC